MTGENRSDWWSLEKEQQLLKLVPHAKRVAEIATALGVTRGAVIGKLERLRRKGVPIETHWSWHEKRGQDRRYSPRPRIKPQPPPSPKEPPPMSRAPEPWQPRVVEPFAMRRLSIMELGDKTCRWPVGEPGAADFFFCGNDTERVYCPVHHRIAYG